MTTLLTYLDVQPEDIEPIEFCHLDCLVTDDNGEPVDDPGVTKLTVAINLSLACWEASLGVSLSKQFNEALAQLESLNEAALWDAFDAAVRQVALDGRYAVYPGDGFVEVYRIEDVFPICRDAAETRIAELEAALRGLLAEACGDDDCATSPAIEAARAALGDDDA